jgi:hypothetical protein
MSTTIEDARFRVLKERLHFKGLSFDFELPIGEYPGYVEFTHIMLHGHQKTQMGKAMIPLRREQIVSFGGAASPGLDGFELNVAASIHRGEIEII